MSEQPAGAGSDPQAETERWTGWPAAPERVAAPPAPPGTSEPTAAPTSAPAAPVPPVPVASPPARPAPAPAQPARTGGYDDRQPTGVVGPPGSAPVRKTPRKSRLLLKRVDPWSVLKFAFVYSLAALVVLIVAVTVLYAVVDGMGVIESVRDFVSDVDPGLADYLSFGRLFTATVVVGLVNVVLLTALATLSAFVYNVCADLVGGIEITLSER